MNQDLETPFYPEELFFSRTNRKGQIQSGNTVFQRVSGFNWDELIGKPHNVVRHPDMPRGVFRLFWQQLEDSRPIGAYVKNKSKDGRYYWVYALAFPIADGFLSIRLKPTTSTLPIIIKEYASLCEVERELTPDQSRDHLLQRIKDLEYSSYQDFMSSSLIAELDERHLMLTGKSLNKMALLKNLSKLNKEVIKIPHQVLRIYKSIVLTPLNLEIAALKVGDRGRSVGVVASTYQKMIVEIEREIVHFQKAASLVDREIRDSSFLIASEHLLSEITEFFKHEESDVINTGDELRYLSDLKSTYETNSRDILKTVRRTISDFRILCQKLNGLIVGLEVIRLTGRMEIGRLESTHGLDVMLNEMKVFQTNVNDNLRVLEVCANQIISILDHLIEDKDSN